MSDLRSDRPGEVPEDSPSPSPSGGKPEDRTSGAESRSRARVVGTRVAIVLAAVLLVLIAADYATSSPELCNACHEMSPRHASWAESAHAEVTCVSCHQAPTEWYELPQRLLDRAELLGRDTRRHFAERAKETSPSGDPQTSDVSNENCLQCHDPNRRATSGFRILIDHPEHAERNETCLSCHINTAHPEEMRGRALSLMDQCFECHGTPEQPEASDECDVCHPSDYEPRPASHRTGRWSRIHGRVATADRAQCAMCHEESFCTDCHGLEMPHPTGWAKGEPASHATYAEQDPEVCSRCHLEKPDLCSMCHHKGWEPRKGPWVTQHPLMVGERGADFCLECHTRAYCSYCHVATVLGLPAPQ